MNFIVPVVDAPGLDSKTAAAETGALLSGAVPPGSTSGEAQAVKRPSEKLRSMK
jgi:hypothetical protein